VKNARARDAALLVLLALALLVPPACGETLLHEDEYRNGVMAREMAAGGLGLPTLHGAPYPDDPLWFWLAALASRALGATTPLALRLPGALGLVLLGLGTWLAARRLGGSARLARVAGALAIVTPQGLWEAHRALADSLLAGLVAVAVALLLAPRREEGRTIARLVVGAAATVLAWLARGPQGVVMVLLPVATDALVVALSAQRPPPARIAAGPLVVVLVGIVALAFERLAPGALAIGGGREPLWFHLASLGLAAPVSLAAVAGAVLARDRAIARATTAWLAIALLFLSVVEAKSTRDLLPVYPALAILAACALLELERRPLARELAAWTGGVVAGLGVLFALGGRGIDRPWLGGPSALAGLGALTGGVALAILATRARRRLPEAAIAFLALAMAGAWGGLAPQISRFRAHQGISELLHATGYRPGQVAVYQIHRDSLCWHWSVSPREPPPHADTVAELEAFLAGAPPGQRVVIVRDKDLSGPLDLEKRGDLERKLYAEEDDYVGVTRAR
jgi:4-amino-4-deoxy-L-arabinose transferase-like glycosyltransferase